MTQERSIQSRLFREYRETWPSIAAERDELLLKFQGEGNSRKDAKRMAYEILGRKYPEGGQKLGDDKTPEDLGADPDPTREGFADIPEGWGELPANASLVAEIQWVQANRLRVVQGESVDLSRSLSPAPSWAALGWLETSVKAYSKYCEIAAKATQTQEDEKEIQRRERKSVERVRALLEEMGGE